MHIDYCGKARGKEATKKKQNVGGWIILGWILERLDGVMWTDWPGSG
jgi:hypothetical protein